MEPGKGHTLRNRSMGTLKVKFECLGRLPGNRSIEERFLDCVSRRFAHEQKRGTLRSE